MNILYIDTSQREKITVSLKTGSKTFTKSENSKKYSSQVLLPLITNLLQERKITLQDLGAIEVHPGPGSFTGLRVGAAVANTLSYLLGIPVNGKLFTEGSLVVPTYS